LRRAHQASPGMSQFLLHALEKREWICKSA
jgi:hypothetical protein